MKLYWKIYYKEILCKLPFLIRNFYERNSIMMTLSLSIIITAVRVRVLMCTSTTCRSPSQLVECYLMMLKYPYIQSREQIVVN